MRDVMDALAELQAIEKAIETAGPLFQTREPLTDKIVSLIGQRSDLITQVLALRRELDAAHIRIYDLEAHLAEVERERDEARQREERSEGATWGATWEECEGMINGILDAAEVPTPKVEDPEALTGERVFWLARDWARLLKHGDLEDEIGELLDAANVPDHFLDPADESPMGRMSLNERLDALIEERDEARRQVAALIEGLQLVSDALARLDQIYRADTDLGDPPVETPAWLREAQHRAAALLAPTTPTPVPEAVEEMEVRDA